MVSNINEWQLQEELSRKWRTTPFAYKEHTYELICWELMFPSWNINSNTAKWNEPSADFILYAPEIHHFLVVELKNAIKGAKNVLSAYFQTWHRSSLFAAQYTPAKMLRAHQECFEKATVERGGGLNDFRVKYNFPELITITPVLMAASAPKNMSSLIQELNTLSEAQLIARTENYAPTREFI